VAVKVSEGRKRLGLLLLLGYGCVVVVVGFFGMGVAATTAFDV
jgi:hypothetical protein